MEGIHIPLGKHRAAAAGNDHPLLGGSFLRRLGFPGTEPFFPFFLEDLRHGHARLLLDIAVQVAELAAQQLGGPPPHAGFPTAHKPTQHNVASELFHLPGVLLHRGAGRLGRSLGASLRPVGRQGVPGPAARPPLFFRFWFLCGFHGVRPPLFSRSPGKAGKVPLGHLHTGPLSLGD